MASVNQATQEAPCPQNEPSSDGDGASVRVLMVDDHIDTGRAMKALLEPLGYQVTTAHSLTSALEAARAEDFDILISDIGLPDGTGIELMNHLRTKMAIKGIALSGFGMEEDIAKSKAAGFAEHFTKPIEFSLLETAIRGLTKSR